MPPLLRRVFVVGGATTPFIGKHHPDFIWKKHPEFGQRENPTLEDYLTKVVNQALDATDTPAALIDKAWVGNFVGELFANQGHLGAALVGAHPDLLYKPAMRVEGACASGGLAFASAVESICAGADLNLVAGVEVQTTASARTGGDYLARAAHYRRERPIDDFTFPALFARRVKHYRERWGLSEADLDAVAIKAYQNAHNNPLAHMRAVPMTPELAAQSIRFLSNPELEPYLKVSDCSQVSDGASALVLASEHGLAKLGKTPDDAVEVITVAQATGNLYQDGDPLCLEATEAAAAKAYAVTGLAPKDIQVAEVHDCFTITELLMMEALGFAKPGQAINMVKDGTTAVQGSLPINTGGGLVGFGHPVGATGVKQILEIVRQMRGQCGAYQMPSRPTMGLAANMGGNDKSVVVSVLYAG